MGNDTSKSNSQQILKGLPSRPYFREISSRILHLSRLFNLDNAGIDNKRSTRTGILPRPLVDAGVLDLKESRPAIIIPIKHAISIINCEDWLEAVGEEGIRELLGLRNTIGTEEFYLPPSRNSLLESAFKACKPNAKPPHLSLAAKARSKHAHRGKDNFFGTVTGSIVKKNKDAEEIVHEMLNDAVWINIHIFGGAASPVIELRNLQGYGARWSCNWSGSPYNHPNEVKFRGFLEPQMLDGHEHKWKH
uniref:Uncharacterized protein n=1 Tax=Chaetoceros debilis TaxID=122233 RepID=A0A7S3PVJ2_9STRA